MAVSGEFYTPFKGRFNPADDLAEIGSTEKPVNRITATTFVGNLIGDVTGSASETGAALVQIFQNITSVGLAANTDEQVLHTFTIPANTLVNAGDSLRICTWVQSAVNNNNKGVKVYFGDTAVADSTGQVFNNTGFTVVAYVFRVTGSTQKSVASGLTTAVNAAWSLGGGGGLNTASPAETLSSPVVVSVSGVSSVAGAANDIIVYATTIDYVPVAV